MCTRLRCTSASRHPSRWSVVGCGVGTFEEEPIVTPVRAGLLPEPRTAAPVDVAVGSHRLVGIEPVFSSTVPRGWVEVRSVPWIHATACLQVSATVNRPLGRSRGRRRWGGSTSRGSLCNRTWLITRVERARLDGHTLVVTIRPNFPATGILDVLPATSVDTDLDLLHVMGTGIWGIPGDSHSFLFRSTIPCPGTGSTWITVRAYLVRPSGRA